MGRLPGRASAACGVFAMLAALALGAAACGNAPDDPPQPPAAPAPAAAPGTGEVAGRLARRPGAATPIVTLEPHAPVDVPLPAGPAEMDQYGRTFIPRLLVVREGQTVRFKNSENELHNVNVTDESGVTIFNVGMPILGGTFDHRFERAGDYAVRCNVHQEMAATISVTSSPFAAVGRSGGAVHPVRRAVRRLRPGGAARDRARGARRRGRGAADRDRRTGVGAVERAQTPQGAHSAPRRERRGAMGSPQADAGGSGQSPV